MNFKGFDPTSMQSKPWSKPFSFYGRERKNQHYVMQSIFAYSPPALLHRDSSCSSIWERDLISWKWAQGKILHAMMLVKRKKMCRQKVKWVCTCATNSKRETSTQAHMQRLYTQYCTHTMIMMVMMKKTNRKKMPIKFVVSAKIIIRNVNSISLERTTFCLHSPRHSFDLFHVMRAMHLSRSRSFFRFFSLVLFHVALVLYLFRFKTFQISHRHNALFSLISSGFSENCPHRNETPGNTTK